MGDIDPRRISMDTEQVTDVAAYYRRSSLVLNAVADDLALHEFGTWTRRPLPTEDHAGDTGPDLGHLAAVYARMSDDLAHRLRLQSQAAGELADSLRNSAIRMAQGDEEVAATVSRGQPAPGADRG